MDVKITEEKKEKNGRFWKLLCSIPTKMFSNKFYITLSLSLLCTDEVIEGGYVVEIGTVATHTVDGSRSNKCASTPGMIEWC